MTSFDLTPGSARRKAQAVLEGLSEDEALTDRLDDDGARVLLNWGTAHMKRLLVSSRTQDEFDTRLRQGTALLRAINHLNGSRKELTDTDFTQNILDIINLAGSDAVNTSLREDRDEE